MLICVSERGKSCRTEVVLLFKLWTIHPHYYRHWRRYGGMVMKSGSSLIAISIKVKRLQLPGKPKAACCNFHASFWNSFNVSFFFLSIFRRRVQIFLHFRSGSRIVSYYPSNSQPSPSLVIYHIPLPLRSFASAMGSRPLCPVTAGGGNIAWMPYSMALDVCNKCWRRRPNQISNIRE